MKHTALILCLLFLASCSSASKEDAAMISRPFSSVDSNRTIVLAPNRSFEIVLPSNPTTGFDWSLHVDNPSVVKNISHKFKADFSGRVGVPGITTWSLRTSGTGEAKLLFSYKRAWEKETAPARVETFTISVR